MYSVNYEGTCTLQGMQFDFEFLITMSKEAVKMRKTAKIEAPFSGYQKQIQTLHRISFATSVTALLLMDFVLFD